MCISSYCIDDFRIFCGDLGPEVTDDGLKKAFDMYPSLVKAKVIRDKHTLRSQGYGFVSFKNLDDYIKAMKEMNGNYSLHVYIFYMLVVY